jgi:hypothetical protein
MKVTSYGLEHIIRFPARTRIYLLATASRPDPGPSERKMTRVKLTTSIYCVLRSRMRGSLPPLPNVYGVGLQYRDKLAFLTSSIISCYLAFACLPYDFRPNSAFYFTI